MIGQDKYIKKIVWVSVVCLCAAFGVPKAALAATMSISVAQQVVYVGDTARVDWFIDTQGQTINVADATIVYDPKTLGVASIDTGTSLATVWAENPTIQNPGFIHFSAGFPAGIIGNHIPILSTTFTIEKPGNSFMSIIDNTSYVYLGDGAGTQVSLHMAPVSFSILPKNSKPGDIASTTHPNENKWYKDHDVTIHFVVQKGIEYSYSFSTNSELIPAAKAIETNGSVSYKNIPDGIYYFKLATRSRTTDWQEAGVFRVQIDSSQPTMGPASVTVSPEIFNNAPFASFGAVDKISGIASYSVRSGYFGLYRQAQSPYKIARPIVGNFIHIRATDVAGNTTVVKVPAHAYIPGWLFFVLLALCTGICLFFSKARRILYIIKNNS